ncbi:hypothetical protein D3C73_1262440 [compost metagenome]
MHQEERAEHVDGQKGSKDAGQKADDQGDATHKLERGDDRGHSGSAGHSHLRERGLRAGDGEFVELLPTVRGEEKSCDNTQDGQGCGGQAGLVHVFNPSEIKLKCQLIMAFYDQSLSYRGRLRGFA